MASIPRSRVIPANEYRRIRWRNGQGWTREIHVEGAAEDWSWRLSIAEIEHDAAFSLFPGVERELMLLSGNGLRLRFDDGECVELNPPHDRHRFAGERPLTGELVDGITHDFNLMWRRDRIRADTWHWSRARRASTRRPGCRRWRPATPRCSKPGMIAVATCWTAAARRC